MDHQGSPPAAAASINGAWGAPSGNYALRTAHYAPLKSPAETTPYSLRPTPSLQATLPPRFFRGTPRGGLAYNFEFVKKVVVTRSSSCLHDV